MGVAGGRGKRLAFYEWVVFWRHIFAPSSTRLLGADYGDGFPQARKNRHGSHDPVDTV